ncbi:medium-chain fatty acid-CoA ligase faa2 [Coemansia aciculifera]|nr:medium-chain fatty acid-CoA ligase faa2 [Coemansia aciculifera]
MFMYGGVRVGFSVGDRARLIEDMQALQPTVFLAIPLLLNTIYERMVKATTGAGGIKGLISRIAYRSKQKHLASTGELNHKLWDRLVFNKVAAVCGGRIRTIFSGSMALSPEVAHYLRTALSCEVLQGYGQSESVACGLCQSPGDYTAGHIGFPVPGNDIRLRSRPELGYLVNDTPCPRGELMMRAKFTFAEYYKQPEKTLEAMDGEWLATGDIVQINPTGTISFISRAGNHVKINTGMWLSPERLENIYSQHPLVHTLFIHAHGEYNKTVSIVVPSATEFLPWARTVAKLPEASLEKLCAHTAVVQALLQTLVIHAELNGLTIDEKLGAIFIEPTPFREKNCGLCTSTLKLKRREVINYYDEQLQKLFTEVGKI